MDTIDKTIIKALERNCRTSYETLSQTIGISAVATRNRILDLLRSGIIERFVVILEPEMTGMYYAFANVHTDGTEPKKMLFKTFSENSSVIEIYHVACGLGALYIVAIGFTTLEGLHSVSTFLREQKSVLSVDMDVILSGRGKKASITKTQKSILQHLIDSPRMSITEIAGAAKMSVRRVRTALDRLQSDGAIRFSIIFNPDVGTLTEVFLKIEWYPNKTNAESVIDMLEKAYPLEFWMSYISSLKPVIYVQFVVDRLQTIDRLMDDLISRDEIRSVSSLVCYSNTLLNFPGEKELIEMVKEHSLS